MKKLFFFFLLLISFEGFSQVKQKPVSYGVQYRRVQADSAMRMPTLQVGIKDAYAGIDTGQFYYNKSDSSVYVYTGTDWRLLRGSGGSGYYAYPINIDSLGAVGDGTTDNAAVFDAARNLSKSTGRPILIPSGTYFTSDSIILNKQTLFGYGANSIIKVTSATVTSIYLQDSCTVFGVKFIGTGAGAVPGGVLTTQNGIRVHGGYNNIYSCFFTSITGSGIGIWETGGATIYQNRATNNKFVQCTVGIFSLLNEEYSIYANNDISYCTVGIWDRSGGNTRWVNNTVTYCTVDGYRLTTGGNGDHSVVVGCTFNHNVTNVNIESNVLGQIFTGCNIMSSIGAGKLIKFGSVGTATGVIFSECNLYDGDIAGTSSSACVIRDCNILPGGAGVTHSGSGITYVNNNGSSDAQYWKSDLNTVGADGKLIGTADNYDFTIKTNNISRVNILKTGEVGIGTAGATGFKMFIVGTGNSASTYHSLYRNADGNNLFTIQDDGTTNIGNQVTGTSVTRFYGSVGIGTSTPDSLLTVELGLRSKRGVRFDGLPSGGVAADSVLVVTSTGVVKKRDAASFGGGGGGGWGTTGTVATLTGASTLATASHDFTINGGGDLIVTPTNTQSAVVNRLYKVYTALLTQSGTDAPTATVLENTLGGTVVWTRTSIGVYEATLSSAFTDAKTWTMIDMSLNNDVEGCLPNYSFKRISANVIELRTMCAGEYIDERFNNNALEIRVYY